MRPQHSHLLIKLEEEEPMRLSVEHQMVGQQTDPTQTVSVWLCDVGETSLIRSWRLFTLSAKLNILVWMKWVSKPGDWLVSPYPKTISSKWYPHYIWQVIWSNLPVRIDVDVTSLTCGAGRTAMLGGVKILKNCTTQCGKVRADTCWIMLWFHFQLVLLFLLDLHHHYRCVVSEDASSIRDGQA